jgi:crotonobetaine/carnitine-CoA ligase
MLDEAPAAFVIAEEGREGALPATRLIAACKAALADFKVPHEIRIVPDELPRSTLEKINKAELRKRLPVFE